MKNKTIFDFIIGAGGSAILFLFGGIDMHMYALFYAMVFDFILGIVGAMIFHSSNKTNTGRLSSDACIKGLIKKCAVFFAVALCYRIDCMLQIDYLRNAAIIGFVMSETISIIENLGLMGVPIPKSLKNVIEVLNKKISAE